MPGIVIVGAQWGDEGKGKVVDLLADRFQVVARYQGGPNAGHTVVVDGQRRALRHIPSGAFRAGTRVVMGNGMVLDLDKLLAEIEEVEAAGFPLAGRFFLSDRAHVILPPMAQLDALAEASPDRKIGTTQRGIGPTYEAKASRQGVRVADLADLDVLRELRQDERVKDTPVLAMSGVYKENILDFLHQIGASGFLDKQQLEDSLVFRVQALLAPAAS